ncbi:MAG: glyoxalase [Opitutus sp.]|nr:glyoxalase [Opitutus sp.]
MITATAIAFTGYPVTGIARARAFYEQVLGLKSSTVFEHEGRHWIEYDIGPGTLAISNMWPDKWRPASDGPCAVLEVADFPAAVAKLRSAGARFYLEPMDSGVCHMAIVADPDGNALGIHLRHKP